MRKLHKVVFSGAIGLSREPVKGIFPPVAPLHPYGRSMHNSLDDLFGRLARSDFRARFRLRGPELQYLRAKGLPEVLEHAGRFIDERLAPADPPKDGKQTPYAKHPVFVAQHATATCCRGCLAKWHSIPKGRDLSDTERRHVLAVLERWLRQQDAANG